MVGVIADESQGPTGLASQDVPRTMAAWQNYVNAHGGINGHPVRYINKDDALDPAKAATAVQQLISAHVVAIMDNSSINPTWATTAANAHIPVLSLNESASGDTYEANPDFFGDGTTVLGILWGHTAMAAKAGGKVFGGVYCTETFAAALLIDDCAECRFTSVGRKALPMGAGELELYLLELA